jgi:predicted amino acid-binding ACT domain protein
VTGGRVQLAVTVIGRDRPGIIADTTRLLAGLGANLEDSTMSILGGHFAMVLLAEVDLPAVVDRSNWTATYRWRDTVLTSTTRAPRPGPGGGTGIRRGLKSPGREACGFDSRPGHPGDAIPNGNGHPAVVVRLSTK